MESNHKMSTYKWLSLGEFFTLIELSYLLLVFLDSFPEHRHNPLGLQGFLPCDQFDVLWQLACPQLIKRNVSAME